MPRKKADGEQAAPARPKRTASQVLSPEQCEYLEAYATTHPDWDHHSVPDEIWESKKFPVFTKPQLAKRISNFFCHPRRTSPYITVYLFHYYYYIFHFRSIILTYTSTIPYSNDIGSLCYSSCCSCLNL